MYCKSILIAFMAVSVANALTTPIHGVRLSHRHSSLAKARAPAPAPEPAAGVESAVVSKRGMRKRCKPRTSPSSLSIASTAASSAAVLPSGVGNVGADPNPAPVSTVAPAPSSSKAAPPPPSPSPPPPAKSTKAQAPAPAPSSSAAAPPPPPPPPPPPKPSTSAAPKPSTSAAPQPQPTSGGGSGGANCDSDLFATGCTRSGQGTFYDTGLTACGVTNNDSQFIAAVSEKLFDQFNVDGNPNHNKLCGRQAQVSFGGKTITVTITDRCTACQLFDLDFTPTAFQALGVDLGVGRISGVQWKFIS